MKKMFRSAGGVLLSVSLLLGMTPVHAYGGAEQQDAHLAVSAGTAETIAAKSADITGVEYTIYPLPREITYENTGVEIPQTVNVVYGDGIDRYTKDHLVDALAELNVTAQEKSAAVSGAFNILVGVRGANDAADQAMAGVGSTMTISHKGNTYNEDIFTSDYAFDAYMIRVNANGITVVGKDTDAAFYGVTTLKHIFAEMAGNDTATIRAFTLRDYASVALRGFIEGYYGLPWSHEDRIALMEWGGEWKMNMYVFAPKDDPYHKARWRELYPADALVKQTQLAEAGLRTKNRYVYALHPFGGERIKLDDANFESELKVVTDKFDQLYGQGVRQFSILADDVGAVSPEQLARLMNALNDWREAKGDVYPLSMCPDGYNESWAGDGSSLSRLNAALDDDIEIFWTGRAVCGHATERDATSFISKISEGNGHTGNSKPGRDPLMWLNWPQCDVNMSRLELGPGSNEGGSASGAYDVPMLKQGDADYFSGIISNPMQHARLNKIPLFAVADFTWNDDDYNGQQSWADCFQFVDPDAAEALHTLAKHMSDPSPNGHGMTCGESEELKGQMEAFLAAYPDGNWKPLAEPLIDEFEIIVQACDDFAALCKDVDMQEEMEPFRRSLRDLSESAAAYLRTTLALEAGEAGETWSFYSEGSAKQSSSRTYTVPLINGGTKYVEPGGKRIVPFVAALAERLAEPVQGVLDPDYEPTVADGFYISSDMSKFQGSAANATDGDASTYYWIQPEQKAGMYVGVGYSTPATIRYFRILSGKPENPDNDRFYNTVLEYRVKGSETFVPVPDGANGVFTVGEKIWDFTSAPLENVVEVRARLLENQAKWLCVREFGIYDPDDEPISGGKEKYTATAFKADSLKGLWDTRLDAIVDDSMTSFAHIYHGEDPDPNAVLAGEFVGVDLGSVKTVGYISVKQDNGDRPTKLTLEYSTDGVTYTSLEENINSAEISKECSISARYIRLRNQERVGKWWKIYDFSVEAPYAPVFRSGLVFGSGNNEAAYGPDRLIIDGKDTTAASYGSEATNGNGGALAGAYIGLELEKRMNLGRIRILQGLDDTHGDIFKDAILEYSSEGKDGPYHPILEGINTNVIDVDLSSSGIKATHVRLRNGADSGKWLVMRTFSVEEASSTDLIDTNAAAYATRRVAIGKDRASIGPMFDQLTLAAGEYIGIKLPRIRELNGLTVNGGVPAGLTLVAGCNELEMKAVASGALSENNTMNARYIRLENKGTAPVTFSFAGLTATSHEIQEPSIISSTMGGANADQPASNLFDGDLGTEYTWVREQDKDTYTVIDIGQVLHIDSLQFIVNDSMNDWIRCAVVEGSLSPDGGWQKLVDIGKADSTTDTTMGEEAGWPHTISYNYSGSKEGDPAIGKDARYLKITLKNNEHVRKWCRIREIGINNLLVGNEYTRPYMKTVNDPTFEGTREVQGYEPQNLTDGNVSTTYVPEEETGYIVYRLSENVDKINQISVLQSPNTLSNAVVSVRQAGSNSFEPIGRLTYSMNEFDLTGIDTVVEIRVDWSGMAPVLHEILAVQKQPQPVDKTELEALLEECESVFEQSGEYLNGIAERIAAYAAAKAEAEAAMESQRILQSGVDQAVNKLNAAIEAIRSLIPVNQVTLPDNQHGFTLYINPKAGQSSTATLTAAVLPEVATNKAVTWTSDDPTVATVTAQSEGSAAATITARKTGKAIITVTSQDNEEAFTTCEVVVSANPEGITVMDGQTQVTESDPLVLYTNQTADLPADGRNSAELTARLTPEGAQNGMTWNRTDGLATGLISVERDADDPTVCTISVTGISENNVGEKTIEVKSTADESVTATFKVRVLRHLVHDVTVSVQGGVEVRPGATVEADINDLNLSDEGKAGLCYQWLCDGGEIAGAESKTYVLTEDDIGAAISVVVTAEPSGTYFYEGERTSINTVSVERNAGPDAPTLTSTGVDGATKGTITITDLVPGAVYEISSDNGGSWEEANVDENGVIGELEEGSYQVRLQETDTHEAGKAATITVKDASKTYHSVSYTVDPADGATVTLEKTDVEDGESVSMTVKPGAGYEIAGVTVDGVELEAAEGADGEAVYTVENVTADVEFVITLERLQVTITHELTNGLVCGKAVTGQDSHTVDYGTQEVITLVAEEGYDLPDGSDIRIVRTNGGEVFTGYTYSKDTGVITITGGVTEDLTITAAGVVKTYQVAYTNMTGVAGPSEAGARIATHGQEYTAVLTAQKGYALPQSITVARGGDVLVDGVDYTYDPDTGVVTILAAAVTGNLSISAAGETSLTPLESVSISGSAQVGKTLTANVSPAEAAHDVNYQWLWVAEDGTETVIEGATGISRVVTAISLNKRIAVRVTPDNDSAYAGSVTSQPTAVVIAADAPTVPVAMVELDRSAVTMDTGDAIRLTATVRPSNATDQTVTWSSSNESVASVDGNGNVTAGRAGSAVITAKNTASGVFATCTITVNGSYNDYDDDDSSDDDYSGQPTTVKNKDGSTTTTVKDNRTGTVTETTKWPDGKVEVVETKKDGQVTTTVTEPDGKKVEKEVTAQKDVSITVTAPEGEVVAQVKLPARIPAPEERFEDVPEKHWAEEAINTVAGLGLVKGVGENRYDMVTPMTRGALATILYRLSNGRANTEMDFADVEKDEWYADAISWAAKYGVVQGVGGELFKPKDVISREQLAVMLCRYAEVLGMEATGSARSLTGFQDGDKTSSWAVTGVAWCVEQGILRGKGGNVLDPTAEVSRAEVAVMLQRFVELMR